MSAELMQNNKTIITQTVIHEIISTLPSHIEHICIFEIFFDGKSQSINPIDLKFIDKRIVIDKNICSGHQSDGNSVVKIMYMNDISTAINQMERPSGQRGKIFDKIIEHLQSGNFVASTTFEECGADVKIYFFKNSSDGPQLIEAAVFGSMECFKK